MDFQSFVDCVAMPCCILSVEKTPEDTCGEIRVVCANQSYKNIMGPGYYDNMLYQEISVPNKKFEEFCYRAAIQKKRMHVFAETKVLNRWTDQTLIPLDSDRSDLGYCQFIFDFAKKLDTSRIDSVSLNTASIVISACVKLMGTSNLPESTASVLDDILEATQAAAGRIVLMDHENRSVSIFCDRVRRDIWSKNNLEHVPLDYDLMSSWNQIIGDNISLLVRNEEDMNALSKMHPELVKQLREEGIETVGLIQLQRDGNIVGYLFVVNFDTAEAVEAQELLELISFFFGSEISNYLFMQRLERLSNFDELTGLKNRHAMMQQIDYLESRAKEHPYGIIVLDLNGLKNINDRFGHVAGDDLLIKTTGILKREFREYDLFRVGGDEFIVLISDIEEDVFKRRVAAFREVVPEDNGEISLAMGTYWSNGELSAHDCFLQADNNMYRNKKMYYDRHPELHRE